MITFQTSKPFAGPALGQEIVKHVARCDECRLSVARAERVVPRLRIQSGPLLRLLAEAGCSHAIAQLNPPQPAASGMR